MRQIDAEEVLNTLGYDRLRELACFGALSDAAIKSLISKGSVMSLMQGEVLNAFQDPVTGFNIVLQGDIAFYKHCEKHDVLTRYFLAGEQIGFDSMIGLIPNSGTDVAAADSLVLHVMTDQFFLMHDCFPEDFGLLMINLARELSREIAMLEQVIGNSTGWRPELF